MAKPGFRKARTGGGQVVAGVLMSGLALAVLAVAVWTFLSGELRPQELDAELCPLAGPVAYVAVVIDTTDRVSPRAQTEIGKVLDAAIDDMRPGTRLGLYLVEDRADGTPDGASRIAALCHPGSGAEVNILTELRRDAQERFERGFLAPVDTALARMLDADSAQTSPIAEALRVAAADLLPFRQPEAPQTVILVSDMVQNSDRFSFFRGDRWAALGGTAQEAMAAPFADVEVQLVHILRPEIGGAGSSFDTGDVTRFWQSLFAQSRVRRVETLATVPAR